MFTGIVQKIGTVTNLAQTGDALRIRVATGFTDLKLGESVAINGVCLTVVESDHAGSADFYLSAETLARSNLGLLADGPYVNLERALRPGDRLSGHVVQGHVDGQARLLSVTELDQGREVEFEISKDLLRYCVEKGSIALNGVSLTINQLEGARVRIFLIPHTWENTNLSSLCVGDSANVEVDVMAKYVEKLCQPYRQP
ncbi:MAG: riboflavin synthase [Bdellovibrionota bacterium]